VKSVVLYVLDAVCALAAGAVLWIVTTGGGIYQLGELQIRAHSAGTAVLFLTVIVISRLVAAPRTPILGCGGWRPDSLGERFLSWFETAQRSLGSLDGRTAVRLVWVFVICALAIRLSIAWWYTGFFSGDDVEILEFVRSRIEGNEYRMWDLRNPFFPMVFIYPFVFVAKIVGLNDPHLIVFAGRLAVVIWSLIGVWAAFGTGRTLFRSDGAGVVTAFLVSIAGLSTRFSASVLPRAVAGSLILVAVFLLLDKRSRRREIVAGLIVGVVAAVRFSEILVILAAVVVLVLERRPSAAKRVALAGGIAFALAVGLSDWLFRGDPTHSSIAIFRYTVLEGGSSRGIQPWYEYLPLMIEAAGLMAIALAALAWKMKERRPLFTWVVVPVLGLSFLPHKEIRYLVPYIPFLMILVGAGLWRSVRDATGSPHDRRWRMGIFLAVALPAIVLHQVDLMRFRRSRDAVACAQYVAGRMDTGVVAFEQSWRAGRSLYLPRRVRMCDINTSTIADPTQTLNYARNPQVRFIGLRSQHATAYGYPQRLINLGFVPVQIGTSDRREYLLFERSHRGDSIVNSSPPTQ